MRVPEGWRETTLGEILTLEYGKSLPQADRSEGEVPVYGSNGIVGTHDQYLVKGPGIVVGRKGTAGSVSFADHDFWPIDTTYFVNLGKGIDVQWAYYQLCLADLSRLNEATGIPGLNRNTAYQTTLLLPPLSEQRRIAETLSSVDEAIAMTQAVIEQTRTVKQAVLNCLLTKGIGHARFKQTEFGSIPEGWKVVPLRTVAHIQTGVAKGKKDIQDPVELPYLRVANVQDGHIDLTELKTITVSASQVDRYSLRPGDVLMTEGGDFDKLGRGDVWKGQVPVCLHQNHVFAVRPNPDLLVSEFLAALTASAHGKGYFLGCAKRTTNLASINSTQVKDFPVLLPGKEEQERIVQQVAAYSLAERSASDALAQLEKTKAALLSDLLTGRKRVSADALSPAV